MAYDNTNTGVISKNDRKQSDKHPDITGTLNVDGVEFFIDGWRKERKDGSGSFYSLRVKRKDKQGQREEPRRGGRPQADMDDPIPFAPEWR